MKHRLCVAGIRGFFDELLAILAVLLDAEPIDEHYAPFVLRRAVAGFRRAPHQIGSLRPVLAVILFFEERLRPFVVLLRTFRWRRHGSVGFVGRFEQRGQLFLAQCAAIDEGCAAVVLDEQTARILFLQPHVFVGRFADRE